MENYFNTIPIYQIFILFLFGTVLHFVFRVLNLYIFPLKQGERASYKLFWQRFQIISWIAYVLLFFTILFYENKYITTVITAIIVGLGWNYWVNIFSGILIKLNNHIRVGDSIETDFVSGTIKNINISNTKLLNETGEIVVIPNSKLKQSIRKHQKQKKDYNTRVFTIKSDRLSYSEVYKIALNCPYLATNQTINIKQIRKDKFEIKASLIDHSFVDKVIEYFG